MRIQPATFIKKYAYEVLSKIFILPFSLLICFSLNGQVTQPCKDFFRPIAPGLNDVHVFNENDIIAVGNSGTVVKSSDGGQQWRFVNSGNIYSYQLDRLSFPSYNIGYAIGGLSISMKTEDHGETWFPMYTPTDFYNNTNVFFLNDTVGFISGENGYLQTSDGGRNWEKKLMPYEYEDTFTAIYFTNDSTGFIAGDNGKILRTTNKGKLWIPYDLSYTSLPSAVKRFLFLDQQNGFAVALNGRIFKTTDGGQSWIAVSANFGDGFTDICFIDANTGYAVGGYGILYKTTNGGNSWAPDYSAPVRGSISSVDIDPLKRKMVMVGDYGNGRSILLRDIVNQTWVNRGNVGGGSYGIPFLLDSTHFYHAGSFSSTDGGESFNQLTFQSNQPVNSLFMIDSLKGFLASNKNFSSSGDEIYQTLDGGLNWTQNGYPDTPFNISNFTSKIHFFNNSVGLVVNRTSIYKTIDGGNSWQIKLYNPGSVLLEDACFFPSGKSFAINFLGSLYRSDDFGENWNEVNININVNDVFYTIYFINESLGFIGTGNGCVYKTVDGGANWIKTNILNNTLNLHAFYFRNELLGYAGASTSGFGAVTLYETTDGGVSWTTVSNTSGKFKFYGKGDEVYIGGSFSAKLDQVNPAPVLGYIAGPLKSCAGESTVYRTRIIDGTTYQWTVSGGGSYSPVFGGISINWNTPGDYTVTVTATNSCGQSMNRSIQVSIAPTFKPEVTVTDSILTVTEGIKYQWYRNFIQIPENEGGNNRNIVATTPANYYVTVTSFNGCIEDAPFFYGGFLPFDRFICSGGNVTLSTVANAPGNQYQWQLDKGSGYSNVSFAQGYSGSTQRSLLTPGLVDTVPFYKFRVRITNGYSVFYGETFKVKFGSNWTGAVSTAWENPSNWSCGAVPNQNTHVTVPAGLPNSPVISSNVSCRSVTVATGASITILSGFNLTITGTRNE